ncbi:uncharacterized protein LOC133926547 [Phragmites australis]|uniref:uncharacterized protein LOC133926547 n=1 Tax=Phragmites australis TaxID=29695 RepID=UPI002D76C3EB|nr:uncharacterized protein LOC133926547 [Phragmites australis]
MVMKPNGIAGAGAGAAAGPSKANVSSPGSIKTAKFKKRKAGANREKAAVAAFAVEVVPPVGAGTAGGDAPASASVPEPATVAEASPLTPILKPAIDAEGSVPAPTPATADASASAARPKPAAAAAATSKGKGMGADNSGGDGRMKSRKERAKERAINGKGKKTVVTKEERGDNKGAGFIFMCNAQTKQECYQNRLFGLPNGKIGMVKKIRPGAKLFLYDFDLKLLYGVYKAASNGGLNLVREAFHGKFPAQVKFKIDKDCLPLRESSFKHAIKENYSAGSKFDPELNSRQVHRLIALFKPVNVPRSAPTNHLEERRHYEERRQPYHFEERRPSLPIEEVCEPWFDEERCPAVIHVPPLEDPYRAPRFAPLPVESRLGHSLANVQDDHRIYYEPAPLAPEPRHIPLSLEPHHVPLALGHHHVPSAPEPRHVPPAYYHTLAPSDESYYRSVVDLVPERYADRTVAEITARDPIIPRDHTMLPGEISARMDRLEELYQTWGIAARGAHVEIYRPGELAARADHMGIATRANRLEGLYRSEQLVARTAGLPRHSTYRTAAYETNPAYAETSQRPISARVNALGVPVSSLYSFSGGPVYR